MKTTSLSAKELRPIASAAFEFVFLVQHRARPMLYHLATAPVYCVWAGLAEAKEWDRGKLLSTLDQIDAERARLPAIVKTIEGIYDQNELKPGDACGLLLRRRALIPHFVAMASIEGWSFKEILVGRLVGNGGQPGKATPTLPTLVLASKLNKGDDVKQSKLVPARIDRAIQCLLGHKLNNPANMTDLRLYLGILGARIVSDRDTDRRERSFAPQTVHPLANETAIAEDAARIQLKKKKEAKKKEWEQKKAENEAKKEAKIREKNRHNLGTGNAS
jgi:hypothetical protein